MVMFLAAATFSSNSLILSDRLTSPIIRYSGFMYTEFVSMLTEKIIFSCPSLIVSAPALMKSALIPSAYNNFAIMVPVNWKPNGYVLPPSLDTPMASAVILMTFLESSSFALSWKYEIVLPSSCFT